MEVEEQDTVIGRYVAKGSFVLESAAHFGSGKEGDSTDLAIMRDAADNPIITGSSIAGVCRTYLTYLKQGKSAFGYIDGSKIPTQQIDREEKERSLREQEDEVIQLLFGDWQSKKRGEGNQSLLMVYDAYPHNSEVRLAKRDGVKISSTTGQAEDGAKYDLEVIEAGTVFQLHFELVIRKCYEEQAEKLKTLLGVILAAFENGEILLGAKTRRGFGRGKVNDWKIHDWDFRQPKHVLQWLQNAEPTTPPPVTQLDSSKQINLDIQMTFDLKSSLLIRSYVEENIQPDAVQLKTRKKDGKLAPLIPGSTLAGVIRHQAERILHTLTQGRPGVIEEYLEPIFGTAAKDKQRASRFLIEETWLPEDIASEIQSRIQIDRFTGAVLPGALFDEKPVWGHGERLVLHCRLQEPKKYEVGLIIQVIKDLWLGEVTIGGGAGIGRGVIRGQDASLKLNSADNPKFWGFRQEGANLVFENTSASLSELEHFAKELCEELAKNGK